MSDETRDKLKPKALELRRQGWTYREIAGSLNISISTCSLWLRHLPQPPRKGYSRISATKSAELYRKIEGWAYAAMLGPAAAEERIVARSDETMREIIGKRAVPIE